MNKPTLKTMQNLLDRRARKRSWSICRTMPKKMNKTDYGRKENDSSILWFGWGSFLRPKSFAVQKIFRC